MVYGGLSSDDVSSFPPVLLSLLLSSLSWYCGRSTTVCSYVLFYCLSGRYFSRRNLYTWSGHCVLLSTVFFSTFQLSLNQGVLMLTICCSHTDWWASPSQQGPGGVLVYFLMYDFMDVCLRSKLWFSTKWMRHNTYFLYFSFKSRKLILVKFVSVNYQKIIGK